jgi:hypothetical protein
LGGTSGPQERDPERHPKQRLGNPNAHEPLKKKKKGNKEEEKDTGGEREVTENANRLTSQY